MAFTKNLKVYLWIVVAAFALTACAKRDSEFAARKNAAGANYVNGKQAALADAAAEAQGYKTDILGINAPQALNGAISVNSIVSVNDKSYQIVTTHYQVGAVSTTTANFDGATFEVNGVCGDDTCNPYYLVLSISKNGQRIKQTGMKKYFYYKDTDQNSTQDLIMSLGANEFKSLQEIIFTLDQGVVAE